MQDNYLREFDGRVASISEGAVVLDRTCFYPEGGGQIGDKGTLSDSKSTFQVTDTRKVDDEVRHICAGIIPQGFGPVVHGSLDWNSRYECMRFHTAQHVLSRYLLLNYGLETVGNMVKPGESRADYQQVDHITEDMKREVEAGVNSILARNLDIAIRFMPREEAITFLQEAGYQVRYLEMVPKSVSEFRVVAVGDYDFASCAGTHVANTGEIGRIVIGKSKNVGAGKQRIYFSLSRA
ncbi:MAG: alanyl-tRNA editing protein [Candidatus Thorarchaeota archaeon]|nr:MAG: alanyl-tRNA editing protein [Candidatus Thorarchaeota archaeon]